MPPPQRELEIRKGWGRERETGGGGEGKDPGNSGGEGVGWSNYFPDVFFRHGK